MSLTLDADFLGAALVGYQEMLKQIESRMADLRHRLHVAASAPSTVAVAPATKKRIFSVAGRAHIVAAQKKRWAAIRKAKQAATAPAAPKRAAKAVPVKLAGHKARAKAPRKRAANKKAVAKVTAPSAQATPTPSTQSGATE